MARPLRIALPGAFVLTGLATTVRETKKHNNTLNDRRLKPGRF